MIHDNVSLMNALSILLCMVAVSRVCFLNKCDIFVVEVRFVVTCTSHHVWPSSITSCRSLVKRNSFMTYQFTSVLRSASLRHSFMRNHFMFVKY